MYLDQYTIDKYKINEFRFSPVGLVPYTKFTGFDLPPFEIFSSKLIETNVINQVEKSDILKPVKNTVLEGIKNKRIIIGYINHNKFNFLFTKVKQWFGLQKEWALGFYDAISDDIYIILDDNIGILGNSKFDLSTVIAHELCHMAAKNYKKTNYLNNAIKTYYIPFYSNFMFYLLTKDGMNLLDNDKCKDILKSKNNIDNLIKLSTQLTIQIEANIKYTDLKQRINKSKEIWTEYINNTFNELPTKEINDIIEHIIDIYKENFLREKTYSDIRMLNAAVYYAYNKVGLKTVTTLAGQEVLYPSEIVCITNQNGLHSSIVNSINKIVMK